MARPQQAPFAVAPSHGTRAGFSYVARRVSPAGKRPTGPSAIHDCPSARQRTGPTMYPTTGMPTTKAPSAFKAMPSLNKNPLRDWPHGVMGGSPAPDDVAPL